MNAEAQFETLPDMLRHRAAETPARAAFHFQGQPVSFGALWSGIERVAAGLAALGLQPKDRVVVTIPNGPEFFCAFYGAQLSGCIAVPLFPGFGPETILSYAAACTARAALVPSALPPARLAAFKEIGAARNLIVTTCAAPAGPAPGPFPKIGRNDTAFLQFTSGSTGTPKAVMISHDNLFTNMRQMIAGMEITPDEIFVSWLPVYHDMGLILKTMVPFLLGCELRLLPTDLNDVTRWLRAIDDHKGTFTAAPDFAYRLCLRRVPDPGAFDLSSLRVALNAAEPVRAETVAGFERTYGLKNVMVAGYGLAEATVGVAMWRPNTPAKLDGAGNVSVGKPFPGVAVRIIENDAPVPPGTVGEIVIKSAALPAGYFRNEAASATLHWKPGWVHTGDLGYVDDDGDLFVVGRKKNVMIQSGRKIFPQEVEKVADRVPGIRYSVAVGIDRGRLEGEQVYVFAEVKDHEGRPKDELDGIAIEIVHEINTALGFRPGRVFLLQPKTIPMTYNGKFQHGRMKELYLSGALRDRILAPIA